MGLSLSPISDVAALGTAGATSTGTIIFAAGNNITLNTGANSITVEGPSPSGGIAKLRVAQNFEHLLGVEVVVTKAGTITGTAGIGSSLFLSRMLVQAPMTITEAQIAMGLLFNASSNGAGTMSRSLAIYSYGNNTSLATLLSVSGTSSWNTGTVTAGTSTSLTQFQSGWNGNCVWPMTFASSSLAAGEYVVGNLIDVAQASSTWSLSVYGMRGIKTANQALGADVSFSTAGVLSSNGLVGCSILTAHTQIVTNNAANTMWVIDRGSSLASSAKISSSIFTVVQHAFVSSLGTLAGFGLTGSTSLGAVTSVSMALQTIAVPAATAPFFKYVGTSSNTGLPPSCFVNGIMSTGAIPAAITVTSTAVTYSGTTAFNQPWCALIGS